MKEIEEATLVETEVDLVESTGIRVMMREIISMAVGVHLGHDVTKPERETAFDDKILKCINA
jgi:hypothetical protein